MAEKFVVVRADVLPEVIMKVIDAKRLLAMGECKTSTQACRAVGISRSAFYKYKDCAFMYNEDTNSGIVTYYFTLKDKAGVFSEVLACLYSNGANILTINQNIPIDSVATATVTVRFEGGGAVGTAGADFQHVREELSSIDGVVKVSASYGK